MSLRAVRSLGRSCFVVACVALLPLLSQCGHAGGGVAAVNEATGGALGGRCPDLTKVDSVLAFDFEGEYKIATDAAQKLKAGVAAAIEINQLAAMIDADAKTACTGLAKDLGGAAGKDGSESCTLAIKAMTDFKARLGARAQISIVARAPQCAANMSVMTSCVGKCDAKLAGGKARVECEPGKLSGGCDGKCEGSCDARVAAKCEGECTGSCEGEIRGSCSATCNGKCDGKTSNAACAGTCEGKCQGGTVRGECKGKCGGNCALRAQATCDGTCNGRCSGEFREPKCTGEVKPPEVSADCKARCDAQVAAKLECRPAQVGVAITGAADAKLAEQYRATLEKHLPLVLKLAVGMGDRAKSAAADGRAVAEGVQGSLEAIARTTSDKARGVLLATSLASCFGGTLKAAATAAGSIKTNIDVSVSVRASASANASGGASGH